MVCMKVIKKNQIIMFVFALLLITAGYINYSKNSKVSLETAGLVDSEQVAGIGDAQLVSNNNVIEENTVNSSGNNSTQSNETNDNSSIENQNNTTIQTSSTNADYFANSRLEREKMYSQMLETYQKIIASSSVSEEQKTISQSEISKIQNTKNSILIAENLIKNKNFKDVVIFVNDYSISVIVDVEKLGEAEIAQIQNIVVREFKANIEDIHVSQK